MKKLFIKLLRIFSLGSVIIDGATEVAKGLKTFEKSLAHLQKGEEMIAKEFDDNIKKMRELALKNKMLDTTKQQSINMQSKIPDFLQYDLSQDGVLSEDEIAKMIMEKNEE